MNDDEEIKKTFSALRKKFEAFFSQSWKYLNILYYAKSATLRIALFASAFALGIILGIAQPLSTGITTPLHEFSHALWGVLFQGGGRVVDWWSCAQNGGGVGGYLSGPGGELFFLLLFTFLLARRKRFFSAAFCYALLWSVIVEGRFYSDDFARAGAHNPWGWYICEGVAITAATVIMIWKLIAAGKAFDKKVKENHARQLTRINKSYRIQ